MIQHIIWTQNKIILSYYTFFRLHKMKKVRTHYKHHQWKNKWKKKHLLMRYKNGSTAYKATFTNSFRNCWTCWFLIYASISMKSLSKRQMWNSFWQFFRHSNGNFPEGQTGRSLLAPKWLRLALNFSTSLSANQNVLKSDLKKKKFHISLIWCHSNAFGARIRYPCCRVIKKRQTWSTLNQSDSLTQQSVVVQRHCLSSYITNLHLSNWVID